MMPDGTGSDNRPRAWTQREWDIFHALVSAPVELARGCDRLRQLLANPPRCAPCGSPDAPVRKRGDS